MADVRLTPQAKKDYANWQKTNRIIAQKIDEMIAEIKKDPRSGRGNPHPLKGNLQGFWARSFSEKHRILYVIEGDMVFVHRFYGHYE
jgi:toxin YoeB